MLVVSWCSTLRLLSCHNPTGVLHVVFYWALILTPLPPDVCPSAALHHEIHQYHGHPEVRPDHAHEDHEARHDHAHEYHEHVPHHFPHHLHHRLLHQQNREGRHDRRPLCMQISSD